MAFLPKTFRTLCYYCLIFAVIYGSLLVLGPHRRASLAKSYSAVLGFYISITAFSLLLLLAMEGRNVIRLLGIRKEGLLESFLLSSGIIAIMNLMAIIYAMISMNVGLGAILERARTLAETYRGAYWFEGMPSSLLPLAALVMWTAIGILYFSLIQAYGIEKLGKKGILVAIMVSALLYNAPLVTGQWKVDDLLILCILFPVIYWITGNSLGLVASYVIMFELPVLAAFARAGYYSFLFMLLTRAAIGLASLVYLPYILRRLKG